MNACDTDPQVKQHMLDTSDAPRAVFREFSADVMAFLVMVSIALGIACIVNAFMSSAWLPGQLFGAVP